jgi:hypothetical protein
VLSETDAGGASLADVRDGLAVPRAFEAVALFGILTAAGSVFVRDLRLLPSFDEGVYLAQTDALRHGQRLGIDIFAAQPPGFHWLLLAAASVDGLGVHQLRLAVMALALIGLLAAYSIGRTLAGPVGGLTAAAVLAIAKPYPIFAAQVSADLPGTVLALAALACVLGGAGHRWHRLLLGGLLFAAAESVKLDAFILLLPIPIYASIRRITLAELSAFAGAALVGLGAGAAIVGGALPAVWHGAVSYHVAARHEGGGSGNVHAVVAFFHSHQPFTWLAAIALVSGAAFRSSFRLPIWPFWVTAAASVGFVLWHRPLHDNHLVLLSAAFAVPVAVTLSAAIQRSGRYAWLAATALALVLGAGFVQDTRQVERDAAPFPPATRWAVSQVDALTKPDDLVVSDSPIVPFLAHRRMPGYTIDTALLRFDTAYLTDDDVLRAIDQYSVHVVVAGRAFLSRPALLVAFERRFGPPHIRAGVDVFGDTRR